MLVQVCTTFDFPPAGQPPQGKLYTFDLGGCCHKPGELSVFSLCKLLQAGKVREVHDAVKAAPHARPTPAGPRSRWTA